MVREEALLNADIRTMDPAAPRAEALLIRDGRVEAVGGDAAIERRIAARAVPRRDLEGITLLPGLIDSHTHLVHQGLLRTRLDLAEAASLEAALRAVRRRVARARPGEVVIAERWDESRWRERRFPRRDELDEISSTVPIVLRRVDGHVAVGNTEACRQVSARLAGVDADSGLLLEEASLNLNQVFPTPPLEAQQALDVAQDLALSLGITTVHDFVVPGYLQGYQRLHARGRLRIRAHVSPYVESLDDLERTGIATGWGDDQLRLSGVKLFADGSLGGHTAALHEPYGDRPETSGRLTFDDAALAAIVERADRAGLRVSAHAIGDRAIDQVAHALSGRQRSLRHRIEHYELHTRESEAIVAAEGIVASMQPNFVGAWSRKGGLYHARIGRRAERGNAFRRLLRQGIHVAFGSDCMPLDPWFGLDGCVNAPVSSQRLPFDVALACYTRAGAEALASPWLGRLRRGAHADFVEVRLDERRPGRTHVRATRVAGREVFRARRPRR